MLFYRTNELYLGTSTFKQTDTIMLKRATIDIQLRMLLSLDLLLRMLVFLKTHNCTQCYLYRHTTANAIF